MEYDYLIGHKVKINVFDYNNEKDEFIGIVTKVNKDTLGSIDISEYEKIYIKEDKGNTEWVIPHHPGMRKFKIEILNDIKNFTKFTRFEIMDI